MSQKAKKQYVCQSCGETYSRWMGKCESCGEWNTIEESASSGNVSFIHKSKHSGKKFELKPFEKAIQNHIIRKASHLNEFDHVCGGGIVQGSSLLIGGEPGIGKSTLLLQVIAQIAKAYPGEQCVYISGEEAEEQISLRAQRLQLLDCPVQLATASNVTDIIETIGPPNQTSFLIIDSIQTLFHPGIDSAPGTVSQVRACSSELIQFCKKNQITLVLVGHVTKEGNIAGPKIVEHMVDTVLYFEGDQTHHFRLLRAIKNRFGPADEVGVFEMTGFGLQEVKNPSTLFLPERDETASSLDMSGTIIFVGLEGSRPILLEIQALVGPQTPATPRRNVVGWDYSRLSMILAVLETKCNVRLSQRDVYLNVAGGIKITEPAADLAVAAAIISCLAQKSFGHQVCFAGEIGLSGEIRRVSHIDSRIKEAEKLGFETLFLPATQVKSLSSTELNIKPVAHLREFVQKLTN